MPKTNKSTGIKQWIISFIIILAIILVFAFFDYLVHQISPDYAVPEYYFRNKIIFGTIIGFIAFMIVKNKPVITKTLVVSLSVAVLLQTRYYLTGYPLKFVLEFLVIHALILLAVSYITFKIAGNPGKTSR